MPDGSKLIPAEWQSAVNNTGLPGTLIGLLLAGFGANRYGMRPTYIFGMLLMICVIFLFVFCQNMGMLLAAEALANIPWGIFRECGGLLS